MRRPARVCLALALLAMSSCSGGDELDGSSWLAVQLGPHPTVPDVRSTISFHDGQVSGSGGCNSYTGTYEADASSGVYGGGPATISIRDTASTQIGCDELVASQEGFFFDSLAAATTYSITVDRLELRDGDELLLAFVRT